MILAEIQKKHKDFFKKFEFASEYNGMVNPIIIKCKVCKTERLFTATRNAIKTTKCLECERVEKHNNFVKHIKRVRPYLEVVGNYIESKKHIKFRCTKCNYEWDAMPFIFTRKNREPSNCPNCLNRVITLDTIKRRLKKINPDIEITSKKFVKTHDNLKLRCKKCNYKWEMHASKIFQNDRLFPVCQECSSRIKVSHEDFMKDIKNTKIKILGEFVNYKTKIKVQCKKCNFEWEQLPSNIKSNSGCPICAKKTSKYEQEIYDFLVELGIKNIVRNKFFFNDKKRFEADIYLSDYNLAIDFHGLYFHSNIYKEKTYHLDKLNFFNSLDISIVQIFENEWLSKQEVVKDILKRKLGLTQKLFGRKCIVKEIDTVTAQIFSDYHLAGFKGGQIKIGLFHEDELVSVMILGKNRFNKNTKAFELIRYVIHPEYAIYGGMKKMLKYLEKEFKIYELESYIERRYFNGDGYYKNGFQFLENTQVNYFYFKPQTPEIIHSRIQFQKHKLEKKLDIFDPNLTELKNMDQNGYLRIYDCGNIKVQYKGEKPI